MDRMFAVKRASCFFTFTNGVAFLPFYFFTFTIAFLLLYLYEWRSLFLPFYFLLFYL